MSTKIGFFVFVITNRCYWYTDVRISQMIKTICMCRYKLVDYYFVYTDRATCHDGINIYLLEGYNIDKYAGTSEWLNSFADHEVWFCYDLDGCINT